MPEVAMFFFTKYSSYTEQGAGRHMLHTSHSAPSACPCASAQYNGDDWVLVPQNRRPDNGWRMQQEGVIVAH